MFDEQAFVLAYLQCWAIRFMAAHTSRGEQPAIPVENVLDLLRGVSLHTPATSSRIAQTVHSSAARSVSPQKPHGETATAIAALDAQFSWLRGVEKRLRDGDGSGQGTRATGYLWVDYRTICPSPSR